MEEGKYIKRLEIISGIAAAVLGTLFHFVYEWSGKNMLAAVFFPVNESVWEHLKLLLYPLIIVITVQSIILRKKFGTQKVYTLVFTKTIGLIIGMIITVSAFYTYSGIIGKEFIAADIIIFLLAVLLISLFAMLTKNIKAGKKEFIGTIVILAFLIFVFTVFTFIAPKIPLFTDINSDTAGI